MRQALEEHAAIGRRMANLLDALKRNIAAGPQPYRPSRRPTPSVDGEEDDFPPPKRRRIEIQAPRKAPKAEKPNKYKGKTLKELEAFLCPSQLAIITWCF
ncbi:hypothetical protein GJ744_010334 [Endocarpon pusillum]|uniref:Uncharacterized protein n=1 Tax=Endocarpon pusillum TaxID=364733 RepID=A0A8H7AEC3_9EURO|nr:hypothetical protein GJ744_010334 [Endocarpon pusillum]